MSKKQYGLLVLLIVVASFMGGALSTPVFAPRPALAGMTAEIPEVIKAREFRVVDSEGNARAVLSWGPTQQFSSFLSYPEGGYLKLYDNDGKVYAELVVYHGTPMLRFLGQNSELRMETLRPGETSLKLLHDRRGKIERAKLALNESTGLAQLQFFDKEGTVIFKAPAKPIESRE